MKYVQVLVNMLALCLGTVLFQILTDKPIEDAYGYMYWNCFGAGYIAIKYKVWRR